MDIFYRDSSRGIEVVGWPVSGGRYHLQTRQYIPDSFFKTLEILRDVGNPRLVGVIPSVLEEKLLVDGNGKRLDPRDPEREKKKKQIFNDIDYRKLRVREGRV